MIVIFMIDLKKGIIPDKIIFPTVLITALYLIIFQPDIILVNFLAGVGAFLFFLFLFIITRARGIGFGDVKFSFLIGLILGFPATIFALYLAFLTGGLVGLILILWKKKKLRSQMPFGPFLAVGVIITLIFQKQIYFIVQNILQGSL
jgi:prepilin signal peptidase PulO-like enzyme (type II secretory pathway)